jgi:hypothetical protein
MHPDHHFHTPFHSAQRFASACFAFSLVTESQRTSVRETLDDADDGADSNGGQEALVLDNLCNLVFSVLGLSLVVNFAIFDVLGGRLGGFGVALGRGRVVEGVAVEEILESVSLLFRAMVKFAHVGDGTKELDGGEHIGGVEQKRE